VLFPSRPEEALTTHGAALQQRRTAYSILVVGGSGLFLAGPVDRPTGDLDVVVARADGGLCLGFLARRGRPGQLTESARSSPSNRPNAGDALGPQNH